MIETLLHIMDAGGFVMYPLLIFLIAAWTIGIERFKAYRKFDKEMHTLYGTLKDVPADNGWKELCHNMKEQTSPLCTELYPIMYHASSSRALENRYEDVISYNDCYLKRGLQWLSMIVTMAPLLGLLGTVLGMIRSFHAIGGDINSPTVITGGVSEALIATAMGLTVAIVALAFHSYCSNQVNKNINHLEHSLGMMVDVYNRSEKA